MYGARLTSASDLAAVKDGYEKSGALGASKLHAEIFEKYQTGLRRRVVREADWFLAKEFLRGNHYSIWKEGIGIVNPTLDAKFLRRPRLIWNKQRINVATILSYLLRTAPAATVTPNTGDWQDQAAADIATKVLYHYALALGLDEEDEEVGHWMMTGGFGITKQTWDPKAGPQIPVYQMVPKGLEELRGALSRAILVHGNGNDGAPVNTGSGLGNELNGEPRQTSDASPPPESNNVMPFPGGLPPDLATGLTRYGISPFSQQVTDTVPGGDVRVDILSPFEFVQDPGARRWDFADAQWASHATMIPVPELQATYPEFADRLRAEEAGGTVGYARRALQSFGLTGSTYNTADQLNRRLVIEYWAPPGKAWPHGLRAVCTRDVCLEAGPTPPGHDYIPFAMWGGRRVPGEFYPDSVVRDSIPLQKELNKRISQTVEILNKHKSKWVVVRGSVDETQINNETGEVIEHEPGQRPSQEHPPPMPGILKDMIELTGNAIDDMMDVTAVMQGRVSGDVRSGRQTAYLGQYGETRLNLPAKHYSAFKRRQGRQILELVAANVTDTRLGRIVGRNRKMENFYFKGSDLRGNTSVTVETGSLLGFTRQERFDRLVTLKREGVITGEKFLENLEIEDFYSLIEDIAQDRNVAMRENEMWRRGMPLRPPFYFENDEQHLVIHNAERKGGFYENADPAMRAAFDAHCQAHEQKVLAKIGQPGQEAGGPPSPPPAGPPGMAEPPGPETAPSVLDPNAPGGPESAQEMAAGLPPVPPVPTTGPEQT